MSNLTRKQTPRPRTAAHQARVVDLRNGSRTSRYSKRPDALKGDRSTQRRRAVRNSREGE